MSYELVSVILPVYRQADHLANLVCEHREVLAKLPVPWEVVLVPNGPMDGTRQVCADLADSFEDVRVVESEPGWGSAVQTGLGAARGDLICYTNSARTAPEDLLLILYYAVVHTGIVIKANRKTRDNWRRRLGSLLYNLECRLLFDLPNFDVNGTPKAFPREFQRLLTLSRSDDLIDVEFTAVCRQAGYPMLEVPITSTTRHGGASTTGYGSALRMYLGALRLRGEMRRRGEISNPAPES